MDRVDAHHHLWHPSRGDYSWMPADDPILTRPYLSHQLAPQLASAGVSQTVLVQAAPSTAETEYLLGIADSTEYVAGVVGWIDFERPRERSTLARLAQHPKLLGVRPMVQDIADRDWLLRADIQWAFDALIDSDLCFDALGFPQHIKNFHTIFTRYPSLRSVVDHCFKPRLRDSESPLSAWREEIARLAAETGAWCKLSGLVTEAAEDWHVESLRAVSDHVIACFGAERVMWGSDWPVVRLRCEYRQWVDTASELISRLPKPQRNAIFAGNARRFYGIPHP